MATRWPGVRSELGIETEWQFAFVPPGTVVAASEGAIALDVGGSFGPGVIDHHQGTPKRCSAARLLFERPDFVVEHLVTPWRRAVEANLDRSRAPLRVRPRIVLHRGPDLDAMTCACLAMSLVEEGRFPAWAREAVDFADQVDQGRERLTGSDAGYGLYPRILMLMNAAGPEFEELARAAVGRAADETDELRAWIGVALVQRTFAEAAAPVNEAERALEAWLDARLDADRDAYLGLLATLGTEGAALRDLGRIRVPAETDGAFVEVAGAAIAEPRPLAGNKLYLRSEGLGRGEGTPLTVIRLEAPGDRRRFIVSVDPEHVASGGRPTLRGLGAALEACEEAKRRRLGEDVRAERQGPSRFPEFPGIRDPWYDGRAHGFTIVDSPNVGTVLELAEIEAILRSAFWEPPVRSFRIARMSTEKSVETSDAEPTDGLRLDGLLERVEGRRTGGKTLEGFLLVAAALGTGWGDEPTARLVRAVAGQDATLVETEFGACHVGCFGIAVVPGRRGGRFDPTEAVTRLRPTLDRIGKLVTSLGETESELAKAGSGLADGKCRGALRKHLKTVAEFHIKRATDAPTADLLSVTAEIERRLDIEDRIRGVGQLLEHLNDDRERSLAAQLNRIVLLLGAFGVIEATGIVAERWKGWGGWDLLLIGLWLVLIAGCIASLFGGALRFLKWSLRGLGLGRIADTFLDDVEVELDASSPTDGAKGPDRSDRPE